MQFGAFLDRAPILVEPGGRRSTAADPPRLTPVQGPAALAARQQGAEALARLRFCGVDFGRGVSEDRAEPLYGGWLFANMDAAGWTLQHALAQKVLDTLAVRIGT